MANVFGETVSEPGFFTIAIWTGILLIGVVVVMLVFAVDMTYSVQICDHVDSRKERSNLDMTKPG